MPQKSDFVLLIDEGNTLIKWAIFADEHLLLSGVEKRISKRFFEKLKAQFPELHHIFISSVRKEGVATMPLPKHWQRILLDANSILPFKNAYKSPKTLGADRKALTSAACNFYPKNPVLIIGTGTCITFDFKDNQNIYHGGAISPGLQMRLDAMSHFTAKLPALKATKMHSTKGDDTESAMFRGAFEGVVHEINGFIESYRKEYGATLKIMLAGGDALRLESYLKSKIFVEPQLALYGLFCLYQLNTQK